MPVTVLPVKPGIVTHIELPPLGPAAPGGEFRNLLASTIATVDQQQKDAHTAVNQLLNGDSIELHSVALAGQRAELSMDLFLPVSNKVLSAYQEIMKMQM